MPSRKKKPLTPTEHVKYKDMLKEKSDKRIKERENSRGSRRTTKGKTATPPKSKPVVTADNRKEVVKGSKASGVKVNNKFVRQGKVKAAEKAVRKVKAKAAAKVVAKKSGIVGALLTAAQIADNYQRSKTKGNIRPGETAKQAGSRAYDEKNKQRKAAQAAKRKKQVAKTNKKYSRTPKK
jgi:glucose dehydrogenase